ncbi:MAG: hypothetical protein M2R45_02452 [Verrucomicrobia subdivision 3 bacterium]|nr:hypothetical protein [Limisphaerales bacterium]MCS1413241.1 hypothetical protein [Limisphaerales bacterium]
MAQWSKVQVLWLFCLRQWFAVALLPPLLAVGQEEAFQEDLFVDEVLPVFADRCFQCHGEKSQKGGLRLDSRAAAVQGGDSGSIWLGGNSANSEIVKRIMASGLDERMPPRGEALTAMQINAIKLWIDQGAVWPDRFAQNVEQVVPQFWSLSPLVYPSVPEVHPEWRSWAKNPVDAFVLDRLRANQLEPSPQADRRTLIRRLYYGLLGLPPSPEQIERFVADPNPLAYERLVAELLASPHYGERWARHWLDLVHFGETHGYDKDKLRPNAWPYRDYVIRALNDDRPYSRFVREQLAGDALYPEALDGLAATGFISAGPWDWIGHAEVSEDKIDGKVARNLDRADMVMTTMSTFTSMTVQCARCHDHKFDPVNMRQYYGLQAVFAALDRSDAEFDVDPRVRRSRSELSKQIKLLEAQQKEQQSRLRELGGDRLAEIEKEIKQLEKPSEAHPAFGYHSEIEERDDVEKWVQVDLGSVVVAERIEYIPAYDDYNGIGAGFGFPVRYRIEVSDRDVFKDSAVIVADYTGKDVTNPKHNRQCILLNGKPIRFVRITATKLAPRNDDYIFALAEVIVLDQNGENVARSKKVTALDSIESGERWGRDNLVDGIFPGVKRSSEEQAAQLAAARENREVLLREVVPKELRGQMVETEGALATARQALTALPAPMKLYVGRVHTGRGAFRGTGANGGKPREIRVLHRGDVTNPGELVRPGAIDLFEGGERFFELPPEHHESERRIALAEWILDRENPLTWRSIVNRLWQHHFGRGIVDSPNDFGRMGQRPTHPDLLDWLAVQFRDHGQSIKAMHRLIVCSAAYQQSSAARSEAVAIDGGNRYFWRMNRRRLDAESIRDSVLLLANHMNSEMFGPSFQDFVIEKPEHSPHYQYHLHDPMDVRSHRRSVYRFLVRSQQQPFMTTLDCADPSMMVGKRAETLTPLQALSLLNNRFMTTMAEQMAASVCSEGGGLGEDLERLFYRVTARIPAVDELKLLVEYAEQHGAANACRVMLNLNEFVFVD